jgi:demethoxyubiquinone hydroxylase (CLK1/Coq7/Cat5 family)
MLAEEERHGAHALEQGGEEFPAPVKRMMRTASQVMTKTTYWL